jgi:hypothetical protein
MDENLQSAARSSVPPLSNAPPAPSGPIPRWFNKFLACNPFYLVSAALLLYGFYLISADDNFPGKQLAQLVFNFSSLQLYEILLVATAIFLAQRAIWYDSNLLIGLENLLVLVPFILISQAALIGRTTVWAMCLVAGLLAVLRFGGLKRFHTTLNLPPRLLAGGLALLLVNIALPLIYRTLHESKVGTKPTEGPAYDLNEYSWLLILPALIALANCLPRPAQSGDLLPQRRWLPSGMFALWLAGSTVHLYCLGYVYNFDWELPFLAPPLWALAWTIQNRHRDFLSALGWVRAGMIAPALVTLVPAVESRLAMFEWLTGLNALLYGVIFLKGRSNRMAFHLMLLSLAALGLGVIKYFEAHLPPNVTVAKCILAFAMAYAGYWIVLSRQPKLGAMGAVIIGVGAALLFENSFEGPHFAVQAALIFLMLHSLLWNDDAHEGAKGARVFAACLWIAHSLFLVSTKWPHGAAVLSAEAGLVVAAAALLKLVRGQWPPAILPAAAGIVLLMHPGNSAVIKAQSAPVGLWVVAGSFLLFAAGTLFALNRSARSAPAKITVTTTNQSNPGLP